jgi:hypothetical protein
MEGCEVTEVAIGGAQLISVNNSRLNCCPDLRKTVRSTQIHNSSSQSSKLGLRWLLVS